MWGVAPNAPWISIDGSAVRTGPGAVTLVVATNSTSALRTGTVDVADHSVTLTQAGSQADAAFGHDGKVTIDFGGLTAEARAVAVQPDGKIVVAGQTRASTLDDSGDIA